MTPITLAEPRVTLQVAGKSIPFLVDMGATYSVLPSFSGTLTPSQISVMGVDGTPSRPWRTPLLNCSLDGFPFSHSFLVILSCPILLLGRDVLQLLGTTLQVTQNSTPSSSLILPLLEHPTPPPAPPISPSLVNPQVWHTSTPTVASHHRAPAPVVIRLKQPDIFPS